MYLLDANVLIEAKNRYYAFDIAPGFWTWLDQAHRQSMVGSIETVRDELLEGSDLLADWARTNSEFFRPIDQETTAQFPVLSAWANSRKFTPAARAAFTGNDADYLLVAYACAHQHTVVTHERPKPAARKRILIPDACQALGVHTSDPFHMLRRTGAKLDLRMTRPTDQSPQSAEDAD